MTGVHLAAGLTVGLVVLTLHALGARGAIIPGVLKVPGERWYSRYPGLDTLNHLLSGVSLGALTVWAWSQLDWPLVWLAPVGIAALLAVVWEWYELRFWHEPQNHATDRTYYEDTQADVLAVIVGAAAVAGSVIIT